MAVARKVLCKETLEISKYKTETDKKKKVILSLKTMNEPKKHYITKHDKIKPRFLHKGSIFQ